MICGLSYHQYMKNSYHNLIFENMTSKDKYENRYTYVLYIIHIYIIIYNS